MSSTQRKKGNQILLSNTRTRKYRVAAHPAFIYAWWISGRYYYHISLCETYGLGLIFSLWLSGIRRGPIPCVRVDIAWRQRRPCQPYMNTNSAEKTTSNKYRISIAYITPSIIFHQSMEYTEQDMHGVYAHAKRIPCVNVWVKWSYTSINCYILNYPIIMQ